MPATQNSPQAADAATAEPRVVHIVSSLDPKTGGPVAALAGLAHAQHEAGVAVQIISTFRAEDDHAVADRLRDSGMDVTMIGPTRTPLRRHGEIAPVLRESIAACDVVHIHSLWEEIQHRAARIALDLDTPYLITPNGMLAPWSLAQSVLKKRLYMAWRLRNNLDRAAAIHYTTPMERDLAAALRIAAPPLVETLGVNLSEFETLPERGVIRRAYPQVGDRPIIMFLGRLYPGKGLEHLIPALARMQRRDAMLLAVGPDSDGYQRELADLAETHGVADRVIFTGLLSGAARVEALVDATLFALPSDHENFGVAVIEALAAGVPAVISKEVGIRDALERAGVCAVTERDADALAATLDRWLNDDALRNETAQKARPFVWRTYNWAEIARRWIGHYRDLAAGRPPVADAQAAPASQ